MNQFKIAENLVYLRHRKGITQEILADFLGVSKASVSKWETGLSMPDITQLPKLASYYDVTIDELLGYEAQLTMKEIKQYYEKFAEAFTKCEFNKVWTEIREFSKLYYSCYPALLQIAILLLNHYPLADESLQPELLEEMVTICEHIQNNCIDVTICTNATVIQASLELVRSRADVAIEKLKYVQEPLRSQEGADMILVQAYQMAGQMDEAMEWNQVIIFRKLLSLVESSTFYLLSNLNDKEIGEKTIDRMQKIVEAYEVNSLHPNTYLKFVYVKSLYYAKWDMEEEALEALTVYMEGAVSFLENAAYLHGDSYFDRLDCYFKKVDDYTMLPRNPKTILATINQEFEHPLFEKYKDNDRFVALRQSITKMQNELVNKKQ